MPQIVTSSPAFTQFQHGTSRALVGGIMMTTTSYTVSSAARTLTWKGAAPNEAWTLAHRRALSAADRGETEELVAALEAMIVATETPIARDAGLLPGSELEGEFRKHLRLAFGL